MSLPKILQHTAADLMQCEVISVSRTNTLRDAIELMTENHIGGMPVLDSQGRCIGLISATDILNYEQEHSEEITEGNEETARIYDRESDRWETIRLSDFALEQIAEVLVSEVMAYELVSVTVDTPITKVAKVMHDALVHRVVVLGEDQNPVGIISSMDFIHLIARS